MTELLQYVASGFFIFFGCFLFVCGTTLCAGWALNAMLLGFKGIKCSDVNIF